MCKVMIITGIKDNNREKILSLIKLMGEKMSTGNSDGLGYMAIDKEDKLFCERWFVNSTAFTKPISNPFNKQVKLKSAECNSVGEVNLDNVVAIGLHTRYATCERNLINVHPFVKDDTALIHNGVIHNFRTYEPTMSTCDSESLLQGYTMFDVGNKPEELSNMVAPLSGYWASSVMTKVDGKYVVDIFKHNASLDVGYLYELGVWVFTTNEFNLKEACEKLNIKLSQTGEVNNGSHIRLNPHTGEVIFSKEYETPKASYQFSYTTTYGNSNVPAKSVDRKDQDDWKDWQKKVSKLEEVSAKDVAEGSFNYKNIYKKKY